jgi:hypothetical protein
MQRLGGGDMLRQQKIYEVVYQIGLAPFGEGNGLPLWEFFATDDVLWMISDRIIREESR